MLKLFMFIFCICSVYGYFTLPGQCPTSVTGLDEFRLEDFYGKWYQAYFYSSDGQRENNCSVIELGRFPHSLDRIIEPKIYLNHSRVDRGLFHRYSIGQIQHPKPGSNSGSLELAFHFENGPRRLKKRQYLFQILATNYNYYATAYTCQYSPLIDKHYIYIWILSRTPSLNAVSKELALKPLKNIGITEDMLILEDRTNCSPKYYDDVSAEPMAFRFPVPI